MLPAKFKLVRLRQEDIPYTPMSCCSVVLALCAIAVQNVDSISPYKLNEQLGQELMYGDVRKYSCHDADRCKCSVKFYLRERTKEAIITEQSISPFGKDHGTDG